MNKAEVAAVCWTALECVAKKESRRDALVAGAEYDITLRVSGEVKTKAFAAEAEAHLAVNHDGVRVVSQAPPVPHLVAYMLGLLPRASRERMLRELPERFSQLGNLLPDVDAELVEAAENLLGRLRAKIQQQVRGSISTSYTVHHVT